MLRTRIISGQVLHDCSLDSQTLNQSSFLFAVTSFTLTDKNALIPSPLQVRNHDVSIEIP